MRALLPAVMASASAVSAVMGLKRLGGVTGPRRIRGSDLLSRTRRGRDLAAAIARAGVVLAPEVFVVSAVSLAVVAGFAAWLFFRSAPLALVAVAAAGGVAWAFVSSADRRYLRRLSGQLPVVAQQLANAIGAGLSLRQAIARAAVDAPEPAATELRRLTIDLDFGARIDSALEAMVERLPDPGLRTMVIAVLVQRVVGGNLSQALTDLSHRLEERGALEREARSATAQARMSAWLVAGLPMAGGVLVEVTAPGTLARTLGQGPGLTLVLVATALQIVGVMMIRRIVGRDGIGG